MPSLLIDVIFLSWIYLAIGSTIRILTEFQQTVKLSMYKNLVRIIGVFAVLFSFITVVFQMGEWQIINIPMELRWVHKVVWESLNFSVLAAVCLVCIPNENSRALSYASQLPTDDPDDDAEEDDVNEGRGEFVEVASTGKYRFVTDRDSESGIEMNSTTGSSDGNGKVKGYGFNNGRFSDEFDAKLDDDDVFDVLPEADDP